MVTAKKLHVSASSRLSSGCTSNKMDCTVYFVQPFSLEVQPDDGLFEAETCICLAVTINCYVYNIIYLCFFNFKRLLFNFMIRLTQRGCHTSKSQLKICLFSLILM